MRFAVARQQSRRIAGFGISVALVGAVVASPVAPSARAADGTFHPYAIVELPSQPDAAAIGDVTGDGRADIVATTGYDFNPTYDFRLFVVAQAPDGSLLPPVMYPTAGSYTQRPGSVAIGDVNGDGLADVVIGLDRYGIQVFPGLADGTLGTATFTASTDSTRVRIGQLDKDGRADVSGIGWGSDTVTTFSDTGAGLVPTRTYPAQHNGWDDLEVGDVTGDGRDDLVVMSGQGFGPNFSVLAQQADGTFAPAVEYSVYEQVNFGGIGIGDTNGDGRNDIVGSYGGNRPASRVALFTQLADGSLDLPVIHDSYDIPEPVELADFDRDGFDDVITLHGGWLRAGVYGGRSDATLEFETLYPIPYASHYSVHGLAVGDVNGDGWADAVAGDYNNGLVILRNAAGSIATVPGAPTLTAAVPGDREAAVTWQAPASDGGSPVTSYVASASPGGASCTTATLGCTITGLQNGTTYSVSVRAVNVMGPGAPSNSLMATPGVAPSAPRSLSASPNLPDGIGLSWQPPLSAGSSPVLGYRVYRSLPGATFTEIATVGAATSWTDTSVQPGDSYRYAVAALNSFGEGPRSADILAVRGTAPTAPRSLSASAGGKGISLSWSAPSSNGGSAVTEYRIYRGTAPGGAKAWIATLASGTTSYLDKSLAKKTRYYYVVTAVNVLGESAPSNEAGAISR